MLPVFCRRPASMDLRPVSQSVPRRALSTHRITAWRALATTLAALASCDATGPEPTGSDALRGTSRAITDPCGGPAPTCLAGCSDRGQNVSAACVDGTWTCPSGVREDLCCDPVLRPGACDPWGNACDPTRPCPGGYTCVAGRDWPIEADLGVCRLGDWSVPEAVTRCGDPSPAIWPDALASYGGPAPIQIEGVVRVTPTCDDRHCDASSPCCQHCIGSYSLETTRTDGVQVTLSLRTHALACAGTNCGFSCTPLQPGRRYRVFGMWLPPGPGSDIAAGTGMMYLTGHCGD